MTPPASLSEGLDPPLPLQTGKVRWVNSGPLRGVTYVPSLNFKT